MSIVTMASSGLSGYFDSIDDTISNATNTLSSYSKGVTSLISSKKGIEENLSNIFSVGDNILAGNSIVETVGNFSKGGEDNQTVYDFLGHFKNGIMKKNRFRAEFSLPKGVSGTNAHSVNLNALNGRIRNVENGFNGEGSINIKCHTATFPTRALDTLKFRSNSVEFRIPYMTSYEPITLSFYVDGEMDSREYFELWQSATMNFGNNTMNFYNEYVSDIKLYLQDEYGEDTYGIILYECYPISIGQFDVGYADGNSVLSIMITISYKSWLPLSNSNSKSYNRTV